MDFSIKQVRLAVNQHPDECLADFEGSSRSCESASMVLKDNIAYIKDIFKLKSISYAVPPELGYAIE